MLATQPLSLRRSPLLALTLVILVIQAYYLLKYIGESVSADVIPQAAQTSIVTVTKTATVGPFGTAEAAIAQPTSNAIRGPPLHDVVLVIKSGATVIHSRIPLQLLTMVPNFPKTLFYSDAKIKIGDWEVHDALKVIAGQMTGSSLAFWEDLQKVHSQNDAVVDIEGKTGDMKDGWALDKYKNVPVLIDAYQKYPDASYYLFGDGDTSMISSNFWPYLLEVSQKHDPLKDPLYWGSLALLSDRPFAHGGSGYLINQAAVRKLIPGDKIKDEAYLSELERNYTNIAHNECCGDLVLGLAMMDRANVELQHKWPFFQGESWWSIPYHDRNFCNPLGTLHHVKPEDMQTIWDFEQSMLRKTGMESWRPKGWDDEYEVGRREWKFSDMPKEAKEQDINEYKYILFRDMYDHLIAPKIPMEPEKDEDGEMTESVMRIGWDNVSWKEWELNEDKVQVEGTKDWEKAAITSQKNCRLACEKHHKPCIQWYFRDGICGLSEKLVYGRRLRHDGSFAAWKKMGVSGWVPKKMEKKVSSWRSNCPGRL